MKPMTMTQQREQRRLFDVRRVPLAPGARRDWLDVLRGELPGMRQPAQWRQGPAPLVELCITAVARGLIVGMCTGAVAGTLLFPIVGTGLGAACGFVVAAPPSVILTAAIAVLAARRHRPLRDPRRFHRQTWAVLLAGVGVLDLIPPVLAVTTFREAAWRVGALVLVGLNAIVLLVLRPAARRIVVAYAWACGWLDLDDGQRLFR